jgi:hypothetical protein
MLAGCSVGSDPSGKTAENRVGTAQQQLVWTADEEVIDEEMSKLPFVAPLQGTQGEHTDGTDPKCEAKSSPGFVPAVMKCNYRTVTARNFDEEVTVMNSNEITAWPGNLVSPQSVRNGTLNEVVIARRAAKIVMHGPTFVDQGGEPPPDTAISNVTVPEANYANVREAMNEMMAQSGLSIPANITSVLKEVSNESEAKYHLKVDAKYTDDYKLNSLIDTTNYSKRHTYVMRFAQRYFSFVFPPNQNGHPHQFFPTREPDFDNPDPTLNVNWSDVRAGLLPVPNWQSSPACSLTPYNQWPTSCFEALGYVSSVTYGRILYLTVSSDETKEKLDAALNVALSMGSANVNTDFTTAQKSTLTNSEVKLYVQGGDPNAAVAIVTGEDVPTKLKEFLKAGAQYDPAIPPAPISYVVKNAVNNQVMAVEYLNTFTVPECAPQWAKIRINVPMFDLHDDGGAGKAEMRWKMVIKRSRRTDAPNFQEGAVFDTSPEHVFDTGVQKKTEEGETHLGWFKEIELPQDDGNCIDVKLGFAEYQRKDDDDGENDEFWKAGGTTSFTLDEHREASFRYCFNANSRRFTLSYADGASPPSVLGDGNNGSDINLSNSGVSGHYWVGIEREAGCE